MPLVKSVVSVGWSGGLNQKYQSQLVPAGSQSDLLNGSFWKSGSIKKRFGTTALQSGAMSLPRKLFNYRDQLNAIALVNGAPRVFTYLPSQTNFGQATGIDDVPEATVIRTGYISSPAGTHSHDVASTGSIRCVVWCADATGTGADRTYYQFFDEITQGPLGPPGILNAGVASQFCPHVFVVGTKFVATFTDNANNLYAATANTSNPLGAAFSATSVLSTDVVSVTGVYDAQPINGSTNFAVAYERVTGGLAVKVFSSALALQNNTVVGAGALNATGIGVCGDSGEQLWAAYATVSGANTLVRIVGLNPATLGTIAALTTAITLTLFTGPTRIGLCRESSSVVCIAASSKVLVGIGAVSGSVWRQQWSNAAAAVGPVSRTRHLHLHSRPFTFSGHTYAIALFYGLAVENTAQPTAFLIDLMTHDTSTSNLCARPVATIAPSICTSIVNVAQTSLVSVPSTATGKYVSTIDVNAAGSKHTALSPIAIDLTGPPYVASEFGDHAQLPCGTPSYWDGTGTGEIGFTSYPEGTTAAAGGGTGLTGDYIYVACFEYFDSRGQQHLSAPCVAASVTGLVNKNVLVTIPTYTLTMRQTATKSTSPKVGIALFRSVAGGTVLYRLPPDNLPASLFNDLTADTIVYTDSLSDASLSDGTHAILAYTNGAELPNAPPPAATTSCVHGGRLFLAGGDDRRNVWFSKPLVEGQPVCFAPAFYQRFEEDILAIASLDGVFYAFSATSIFAMRGAGPDATGGGDSFSAPERVRSPVGCIEPRSIVAVGAGLLFRSNGGFWLLDRGGAVGYLGKYVEDTAAAYPNVTSAVWLDDQSQARIAINNGSTGRVLVYDEVSNQWSVYSYQSTVGVVDQIITSAVKHPTYGYCMAHSSGTLAREDQTLYTDFGTFVVLSVTSAWIHPGAVAGYMRVSDVYITCERVTDNDLHLALGYDYESTFGQTCDFLHGDYVATIIGGREQVMLMPWRQKCESIRVKVTDGPPTDGTTGTGAGPILYGLDLVLGISPGGMKLPAAARG